MSEKDSNDQPVIPNKSQIKREMTALQKAGEALIKLTDTQLDQLPIPENLRDAVKFARTLKTHESIRRQLQFIGKLMREIDPEPVHLALKKIQTTKDTETAQFHEVEEWREKLITGGDEAVQEFLQLHPDADRQHLRQLVRNAIRDRKNSKNAGAEKEIFKYIRSLISTGNLK